MPPPASILIPTRRRLDYLAVTLGSVAAQARARGAELIVIEDDPADATTERLAADHGARYLAHGESRGLNAARNTGVDAAAAELLCFLDDDVDAWPGWLEALLAAAGAYPSHEVLGGPIRARLEGTNLRACGREAPPVTTLDLGRDDTDARFVWGANMTLRRAALQRAGRFDPALELYGDEEDWQRRLRAHGGRIRYVAAAGVDHRRAGADARIRGLARAAYFRGRHSRRYDVHKGTAPGLPAEARTLAGCVWHTARRRCGNGIVMAAHSAGRAREALDRRSAAARGPAASLDPAYLSGESGTLGRRALVRGTARDALADAVATPARMRLRRAAGREPPQRRVLALAIARPEHAATAGAAARELRRSRHAVEVHLMPPLPGAGKWQNLNAALAAHPPQDADWLLLFDDDVVLPRGFLDAFVFLAERFGFVLAQPAHRFDSHAAWRITRRRRGSVARRTRFVEIGPVTAVYRDAFATLLPFPDLRMGWGLDAHWSAVARSRDWPLGVVDATPVRHTRPVAGDYPREAAMAEAQAFLADRAYVTRDEAAEAVETHRGWERAR